MKYFTAISQQPLSIFWSCSCKSMNNSSCAAILYELSTSYWVRYGLEAQICMSKIDLLVAQHLGRQLWITTCPIKDICESKYIKLEARKSLQKIDTKSCRRYNSR